jgi:hypothetical protein
MTGGGGKYGLDVPNAETLFTGELTIERPYEKGLLLELNIF